MDSKLAADFKFGLGCGLGFAVVNIISFIIGMIFFVPSLMILIKERKKQAPDKNMSNIIKSYVLMSAAGSGNTGLLFSNAFNDF